MVGDCPWIIPFLWLKIIKWNQQADLCPLTSNNYSSIIQSHWPQDATGNYTCSIVVKDYTPVIWTTCLSFTPSAVFFASRQSSQGTFHGRFFVCPCPCPSHLADTEMLRCLSQKEDPKMIQHGHFDGDNGDARMIDGILDILVYPIWTKPYPNMARLSCHEDQLPNHSQMEFLGVKSSSISRS